MVSIDREELGEASLAFSCHTPGFPTSGQTDSCQFGEPKLQGVELGKESPGEIRTEPGPCLGFEMPKLLI
jgi:hypothetical protein